jgi:hypothetical protein
MTTTTYTLPPPETPYPDWSRFIAALWDHGARNPDPAHVERHMAAADLLAKIKGSFEAREGRAYVRPSSLLSCARQTYLFLRGHEPEGMPRNIALTFAIGHIAEAAGRCYLSSALPPCFELSLDQPVPLPSWWPTGDARFAKTGTNDFMLRIVDPAAAALYLDPETAGPPVCMGDFKTASSYQYDQMARAKSLADKPDPFGYTGQITVYGEGQGGPKVTAAVLALFNRNSPSQPLVVRAVSAGVRQYEARRIEDAITGALAGVDPGRELLDRWGEKAHFYCGVEGKTGMCPLRSVCGSIEPPARERLEV